MTVNVQALEICTHYLILQYYAVLRRTWPRRLNAGHVGLCGLNEALIRLFFIFEVIPNSKYIIQRLIFLDILS